MDSILSILLASPWNSDYNLSSDFEVEEDRIREERELGDDIQVLLSDT